MSVIESGQMYFDFWYDDTMEKMYLLIQQIHQPNKQLMICPYILNKIVEI